MTATMQNTSAVQWPLTMLYDGAKAASAQEINELKAKDKQDRLQIVDVSQDSFNGTDYGVKAEDVRQSIYAKDGSGKVFKGIEALETAYEAIGLGTWFRYCRKPGLQSGAMFKQDSGADLKMAA